MGLFFSTGPKVGRVQNPEKKRKQRAVRNKNLHRVGFFDKLCGSYVGERSAYVRSVTYEINNERTLNELLEHGDFVKRNAAEVTTFCPIFNQGKVHYLVCISLPSNKCLMELGEYPFRNCKVSELILTIVIGLDSHEATAKLANVFIRQAAHRFDTFTGEFVDEPEWLTLSNALAPVSFTSRPYMTCRLTDAPAVELDMTMRHHWRFAPNGLIRPSELAALNHWEFWNRELKMVQEVIPSRSRLERLVRDDGGEIDIANFYLAKEASGDYADYLTARMQIAALRHFEYGRHRINVDSNEPYLPHRTIDNASHPINHQRERDLSSIVTVENEDDIERVADRRFEQDFELNYTEESAHILRDMYVADLRMQLDQCGSFSVQTRG